ncbi:hypothetical protein [Amycolatopsis taiwanensis]|uniref:hypothetical protein n=1 Tax=Amycolatopsis taiwanensis TaxID=342230 RepID=UPI000481F1B5|nr:hypothetical protein [Amycolatopsis taiwanensis]
MNDEVSVTEVMDRDGWPEAPSTASARFRVVAVMLAVVLGCGLAALLVHIAAEEQRADNSGPAVFDLSHGPRGGLAGGGVPASRGETTVTGTSTSITVTNQAPPPGPNELPWTPRQSRPTTVTQSPTQPPAHSAPSTTPTGPGGSGGDPGHGGGSPPPKSSPPSSSRPTCILDLLGICIPSG